MRAIENARVLLTLVVLLAGVLAGFTATKVGEDDISVIVLFPILLIVAILCFPALLWATKWRRRVTEASAIVSVILIIPSFVIFGPIFILPSALLLGSAAALLRKAEAKSSPAALG